MACGVDSMDVAKEKHIFPGVGVMCFKWHPSVQEEFCFCLSVRVLHFEKSFSVVLRLIELLRLRQRTEPRRYQTHGHTASKVGRVGALFLLNIFVTVEWERVCFLCQTVCPFPFFHQFSDSFLRIHIITYLSVSILSPRMVI